MTLLTAPTGRPASGPVGRELIALRDCRLQYQGRPVLHIERLRVRAGEKIALIGASGAGKSTLLKHLREQLAADCAWCPQQPGLVPMLSVFHNMYMGGLERFGTLRNLANLVWPSRASKRQLSAIAAELELTPQLWQPAERLSGGQQQRTAIGRALYRQKNILLADEPVSALDARQAERLLGLLVERHETLILALHQLEQVKKFCPRAIALKNGRVIFDGPSATLSPHRVAELYQR